MDRPINLEAAKELVKTYRSITKDDLEDNLEHGYDPWTALSTITGFGFHSRCSLCIAAKHNCEDCLYFYTTQRITACINDTADNIYNAESIDELLIAIKARADYIESVINMVENGN